MHVIVVAVCISNQRGGIEKSTIDVCRGLHRLGHKISLIYEQSGDQLKEYSSFCQQTYQVKSYRISKKNILTSCLNLKKAVSNIEILDDAVVYCSQYHTFFFASLISRCRRIPLVCHLRLPAPLNLTAKQSNPFVLLKEKLTLKKITKFIAISNSVKDDWSTSLNLPSAKFDVVFNGIDPNVFLPSPHVPLAGDENTRKVRKMHKKKICYVGRLDRDKGVEILIEAFAKVKEVRSEIKLTIVGKAILENAHYEAELKALARKLGVLDSVDFVGYVQETNSIFQESTLSIIPSIWAEPFGRTVIESLSCGTPVIASRVGGIPEILSGYFSQFLVEPNHVQALSKKIINNLDWEKENPSLNIRCRKHVLEKFTLKKTLDGVERSLLESL